MMHKTAKLAALVVVAAATVLILPGAAAAAVDDTSLASRADDGIGGAIGNGDSQSPSISDDGCRTAFESFAGNLTSDDLTGAAPIQVYVRDLCAGTTELVSRATGGSGAPEHAWSCGSGNTTPEISGDGSKVAFVSGADNLSSAMNLPGNPQVNFPCQNVYVRDLDSDTTTLVSTDSTGTYKVGNAEMFSLSISDDGSFVSWATTTAAGSVDGAATDANTGCCSNIPYDVFRWDAGSGDNLLVSRIPASNTTGNLASAESSISNDGSRVAFASSATDLVAGDSNGFADVFLRTITDDTTGAGSTALVSRATGPAGGLGNGNSQHPLISADGTTVGFESFASNIVPGTVVALNAFVRDVDPPDRPADTTELVNRVSGQNGQPQQLGQGFTADPSGDGRFVSFTGANTGSAPLAEGAVPGWNTYLRDRTNQTTSLLSRASGALGAAANAGNAAATRLSANGHFGVFSTSSDNLAPGDVNGKTDIFRREFSEPAEAVATATANLRPLAGTATVNGAPLDHVTQIGMGSFVDVSGGRLELTTEFNGVKESARFFGGAFTITQPAADPIPTLDIPPISGCSSATAGSAAGGGAGGGANGKKKKKKRRKRKRAVAATPRAGGGSIFGSGKGHYRTRGFRGSATVRGTDWSTQDSCAGTFFGASSGTLEIDDFGLGGAVDAMIGAGGTYLAAAPQGTPPAAPVARKKKHHKHKRKHR